MISASHIHNLATELTGRLDKKGEMSKPVVQRALRKAGGRVPRQVARAAGRVVDAHHQARRKPFVSQKDHQQARKDLDRVTGFLDGTEKAADRKAQFGNWAAGLIVNLAMMVGLVFLFWYLGSK